MFRLIEMLRNRSESSRRGLAFGASFLVILFIGGIWFSASFPDLVNFGNLNWRPTSAVISNSNSNSSSDLSSESDIDPITTFSRSMAQTFQVFRKQFGSIVTFLQEVKYQAESQVYTAPVKTTGTGVNATTSTGLSASSTASSTTSTTTQKANNPATNKANSVIY